MNKYLKVHVTLILLFSNFFTVCKSQTKINNTLSNENFMGTWVGKFTEAILDSVPNVWSLTMIYKAYDDYNGILETIQLIENRKLIKVDTLKTNITSKIEGKTIGLSWNQHLAKGGTCPVNLKLTYSEKNGQVFLNGEDKSACYRINLSLEKVSNDTEITLKTPRPNILQLTSSKEINTSQPANSSNKVLKYRMKDVDLIPAAAQLFKTVYKYSSANNKAAGETVQLELSNRDKNRIVENSGLSLNPEDNTSFIDSKSENPFKVSIEACDLNDDGIYEIILRKYNQNGPNNTNLFQIFWKPTAYYMPEEIAAGVPIKSVLTGFGTPIITDKKVDSFRSIIISGLNDRIGPYYTWVGFYKFDGNIPLSGKIQPPDISYLTGGSTPDELGRNLLKALSTNNKALWVSCLHPADFRYRERCENSFRQHKAAFSQAGLTQWDLVKFSRVTFSREEPKDDPLQSGEQRCNLFRIEFTYRNMEFLGLTSNMLIKTYNNKTYFVYGTSPACDANLVRYKKPQ